MNKILIAEKRFERTKFGKEWTHPRVEVWIDYDHWRIGNCNPELQKEPHDWSNLKDTWLQKYRRCRHCNELVDDRTLAWAYWKHEKPICSIDCIQAEQLKRYACCEKARPLSRHCVCMYATECPVHG